MINLEKKAEELAEKYGERGKELKGDTCTRGKPCMSAAHRYWEW